MFTIEFLALLIGISNGFILLVKPIPRVHNRLDLIEYRLTQIELKLDRNNKRE